MKMLKTLRLLAVGSTALTVGLVAAQEATPEPGMLPDRVTVVREGLFPEGVEYDTLNGRFLVGSIGDGHVYAVADDGTLSLLVEDERIPSVTGIEADEATNRLLVAATDLEKKGWLGIYDLTTGENLAFVDFVPLLPTDPEHFINDITVDAAGNAYVTDSMAGVIYRVDPAGNPTIFLEDEQFSTQFALNGLVYHEPSDALLAVLGPKIIRIPLADPASFAPVAGIPPIIGADGLVLTNDQTLVAVANRIGTVYRLESTDDFASAQVTGTFLTGNVFPTTVAARSGEAYVLYAQLKAREAMVSEFPIQRVMFEDVEGTTVAPPVATVAPTGEPTAEVTDVLTPEVTDMPTEAVTPEVTDMPTEMVTPEVTDPAVTEVPTEVVPTEEATTEG